MNETYLGAAVRNAKNQAGVVAVVSMNANSNSMSCKRRNYDSNYTAESFYNAAEVQVKLIRGRQCILLQNKLYIQTRKIRPI